MNTVKRRICHEGVAVAMQLVYVDELHSGDAQLPHHHPLLLGMTEAEVEEVYRLTMKMATMAARVRRIADEARSR